MSDIFQTPAEISKVTTMMNRSLRLNLDTQENLPDEAITRLMKLYGKVGWFSFNTTEIEADDLLSLPALTWNKDKKSPAQRLRAVIYRLAEQQGIPKDDFEMWYERYIEKIIDNVKEKLT